MKSELLLKVKRGKLTEREHFGFLILVDKKEKIISQIGNCGNNSFFLRSCAKPFQALPVITEAYNKFNFTLPELAVICSSHTASKEHLLLIESILKKIGLSEKNLQCGIHDPIDVETRNYLIKHDLKAGPVHNNCSGKHSGMLAVCRAMNWDADNYLDFDHPLQKKYIDIIKKLCNINERMEFSIDGCGAPIYGMPFYKMGFGFLKLFLSQESELIKKAFIQNPIIIGGNGRLDSEIIKVSQGRLIAKVGAEGLCIVINIKEKKALVVKIQDSNIQARSIVTIEALKQLDWLSLEELKNINGLYDLKIKNLNNIQVGEIKPVFKI
ncbi:MAG: asparaginase [Candidatus Gastranaerophilales bacterium]|nr:asparaginase [Candidatus Gastranaerophilales bacterium]